MEEPPFTGNRQLLTVTGADVTPFPDPEPSSTVGSSSFYHNPTALISPQSPPQKLRPIRSNGHRIAAVQSHDTSATAVEELVKMKSEMDADFISNLNSHISRHLPFYSFSSSSDGSGDSTEKVDDPEQSGKRKRRKEKKKMELYLETLMTRVIQKQEQMHQQLMEMIESKEKERVRREEEWRRQEVERAKRDEEIRSQETARSLALINFIQNAMGQDVPIPLPLPSEGDDCETENKSDPNGNKRWPTSEVQALITLRAALDHKFRVQGQKASVWEEVSAAMASMGYERNGKKCKEKWENINKYFKRAVGSGKKRSENAKSCPYFHELETLYRDQVITSTKGNISTDQDYMQDGKVV